MPPEHKVPTGPEADIEKGPGAEAIHPGGLDSSDTSLSRQQLDGILQTPDHTPDDVLNFLDGRFKEELDSDAGVWEGYTIREHTGMVMGQYHKYLADELPDTVKPEVFELVLALHDIGKPEAIQNGSKQQQHRYTVPVVREAMADLDFGNDDIALATALIDGDPIGQTLKTGSIEKNAKRVIEMAGEAGLELEDFWQALLVYYMSDASAYTTDAGGQPSLDFLFQFNPVEGKLSFAPEQQQVVDGLRQAVFNAAGDTNIGAKRESKLSPAQQEQVHSAEFIEWFGDWQNNPDSPETSKIIDPETGEPKVFYHGTNRQFDISKAPDPDVPATLSNHGLDHDYKGIYVSDSPELSAQYADPLGTHFVTTMDNLATRFGFKEDKPSEGGFFGNIVTTVSDLGEEALTGAINKWNEIISSCQARDGRVKIVEGDKEFDIEELHDLLERGVINYSSSLSFDGTGVSWVGEMLQAYGGRFPNSDDELVPYSSIYSEHQKIIEHQAVAGHQILIPAYARPRIIPVFVRSVNPLYERMANGNEFKELDSAFARGFDTMEADAANSHDAIVAIDEFDGPGNIGTNMAVLDSRQFCEAKW